MVHRLTERQRQILQLIANGMTYIQIARELNISYHTVKNHVSGTGKSSLSICERLNANGMAHAVAVGIRTCEIE